MTSEIRLFGGLQITRLGQPLTVLTAPRQQALLAWLVLHVGTPQPRRQVAFALWPDSEEPQALTNLRRELHHLRRALPQCERSLDVTAQTLCWRRDAPYVLDVQEFERAAAGLGRGTSSRAELERAAEVYTSDLLPAADDGWLEPYRDTLHTQAVAVLEALAAQLERGGERARALQVLERLTRLEPLREHAYAGLIRLHLDGGDAAAARQSYGRCVTLLHTELGVTPGPAVRAEYDRVQRSADPTPTALPGQGALIGRRDDWPPVLGAWQAASAGASRALLIAGEAGIGKTRLAEALLALAEAQGAHTARARCYAAEGRLAYAPVRDWLRSPALGAGLAALGEPWRGELARLLPELAPQRSSTAEEPSQGWQRQRLFEALARAFLAAGRPTLLLLDDLQWCDRDTLEWLHFLLRFAPHTPLLLLCTLRHEELPAQPALRTFLQDLQQRGGLERVTLGPLSRPETAELAASVQAGALPATVQAQLFEATEGHPLFVVEAVRAGLDVGGGAGPLALSALPRVQAVIAARLEQLSPQALGAAQLAATIGRAFEVQVLRDASDLEEEGLVAALDELWQRAIIREQPGVGGYDFTHDRLREGAYDSLSPARRRLLHRRVAQALERRHAPELGPVAAQLAAHHEQAGQVEQAVTFYLRAAQLANAVSASQQAVTLARQALRLIARLPAGKGRDQRELDAHTSLAAAFNALRGFASPELETHLNRALHLGEQLGDERAIIASLWGLYALQIVRGDVPLSRRLAERALGLAGTDSGLLTDCHQALGGVDMTEGRLTQAAEHFAVANRLYRQHGGRRVLFGADVGAFSLSWGAHGLWLQGLIEEAREQIARAADIAAALDHPFTAMQTAAYRAISHQLEGDVAAAWASAETAVSGCQRYQIAYYHEWGVIVGGWALARRGEGAPGLERLQRGLSALRQQNAALRLPYYLALLAETQLRLGQPEAARATLDSAQAVASQNGDVWYLPELHRLHGLSAAASGQPRAAEPCFRRALALAAAQGSRSLELRAATSLAAHLHAAGRAPEALSMLAPVEAAFAAALSTPDLSAARTLLHTLS